MTDSLELLDVGIQAQQASMRGFEVESAVLTLETVRSLDYVYFKGVMPELQCLPNPMPQEISIMQWGVNEALQRVLPKSLTLSALCRSNAPAPWIAGAPPERFSGPVPLLGCPLNHRSPTLWTGRD